MGVGMGRGLGLVCNMEQKTQWLMNKDVSHEYELSLHDVDERFDRTQKKTF